MNQAIVSRSNEVIEILMEDFLTSIHPYPLHDVEIFLRY